MFIAIHYLFNIVILWARVVCLIYVHNQNPRAEGVYIRQTTSAHGLTLSFYIHGFTVFIMVYLSLSIVGLKCDIHSIFPFIILVI